VDFQAELALLRQLRAEWAAKRHAKQEDAADQAEPTNRKAAE
jgi:alpha-D-ribose 1-methylphosphonate 5-triphosphate synthase subunit PhnI